MYKEDELNIGQGGDTGLCPFDCDCCNELRNTKNANPQAFNLPNFPWNEVSYVGMWRSVGGMSRFPIGILNENGNASEIFY
jgi:hypothetical protein